MLSKESTTWVGGANRCKHNDGKGGREVSLRLGGGYASLGRGFPYFANKRRCSVMITFCVMCCPRNTISWSSSVLDSLTVVGISIPVLNLRTLGVHFSLHSVVPLALRRALFSASSMTLYSSSSVTSNARSSSGKRRRNRVRRFAADSAKVQSI